MIIQFFETAVENHFWVVGCVIFYYELEPHEYFCVPLTAVIHLSMAWLFV